MAGEDLLDECRAGSGQPDDEDRRGIGAAGVEPLAKECRVEAGSDAPRLGLEFRDIEGRCDAAQRIAGRVMNKGVRVLLPLLERAPERKVQMGLVALIRG